MVVGGTVMTWLKTKSPQRRKQADRIGGGIECWPMYTALHKLNLLWLGIGHGITASGKSQTKILQADTSCCAQQKVCGAEMDDLKLSTAALSES